MLIGNGSVSKEQADKRVQVEYKKYEQKTLSQVEKDYLNEIKSIRQRAEKEGKKINKIDELFKNEKVKWKKLKSSAI